MKKPTILALALLLTLGASDLARAGSAQPGGTRTATLKPTSAAKQLVGRWKLTSVEMNGKAVPLPGNFDLVFELRADGSAVAYKNGQQQKTGKVGRWSAQKDSLLFHTPGRQKPETLRYWLKGNTLTLEPPTPTPNTRIHLQRVRASRP